MWRWDQPDRAAPHDGYVIRLPHHCATTINNTSSFKVQLSTRDTNSGSISSPPCPYLIYGNGIGPNLGRASQVPRLQHANADPLWPGNTGSPSQLSHTTCTGQCWASMTDTQASFFSILPVLSCMGQERIYTNFNDLLLHCHQLPTRATDNLKRCKRHTSQALSLVVAAGSESIRQNPSTRA